ncbi:hypothetical protein [Pseudomonas sp. AP-1]|uniref:hypothetical protein n=1 Tax=Pseudomonas sp. AP-1 TaxID=3231718 RepID=UPI0035B0B9F7
MDVYVVNNIEQNRWWVHMDQWRVSFNTSSEAQRFVERLTARLNSPHSLILIADDSGEGVQPVESAPQPAKGA